MKMPEEQEDKAESLAPRLPPSHGLWPQVQTWIYGAAPSLSLCSESHLHKKMDFLKFIFLTLFKGTFSTGVYLTHLKVGFSTVHIG